MQQLKTYEANNKPKCNEYSEICKSIFEKAEKGIGIFDLNGYFIEANDACQTFLGYTKEEILNISIKDITHPDFQDEVLRSFDKLAKGKKDIWKSYVCQVRKNGDPFWARIIRKLIRDENHQPLYILCMGDDISDLEIIRNTLNYSRNELQKEFIEARSSLQELEKTYQKLKKSESKLRNLFELMNEGLIIFKIAYDEFGFPFDYTVIDCNPAYEEISGFSKQKIIGKNGSEIFHEEDLKVFNILKNIGIYRNNSNFETYFYTFNKHLSCSTFSPEQDVFAILFNDITERKTLEKKLEYQNNNVNKIVKLKTNRLYQSIKSLEYDNEKLQEDNKLKNRFISSMSHELRTPLNSILGFTDLLKRQYFGILNEKQIEYIKLIDYSSRHLFSLINDILDISKIDSGLLTLCYESFSPDEIINEVIQMIKSSIFIKNIDLSTDFNIPSCKIQADKRKFKQVIINLLSNAQKFTPEGGKIIISNTREGNKIKFMISDNGIGIEKSELNQIFQEFYQAKNISNSDFGGTGIGLALSKKIVELHNGQIGVTSEIKKGSTFWFTIPEDTSKN